LLAYRLIHSLIPSYCSNGRRSFGHSGKRRQRCRSNINHPGISPPP
jgi:hypothetical protein